MNNKIKKLIAKKNRSKIICLTAYSKNIASILDKHCDIVLVGDSLGSVLYNYKSTRQVSFNTMIEHSKSVKLGVKKSLMVGDSETDANAAKAASIPVILLENGYTEKNTNEIYHNHLIKDFIGVEKIVSTYLKD